MVRTDTSKGEDKRGGKDCPEMDTALFSPGDRICVAVSGGADSTALLRLLLEWRTELGIVLSVIHVEHGLRADAGKRDAIFVRELAHNFELPCEIVRVDVPARVVEQKESVEEAARQLRYGAFGDLLAAARADKIATAHTLDDQAETVLMKLLRGAWTDGLSGIHPVLWLNAPPRRHCVIRPLLGSRRAEIETYLRSLGQPWCEDETNQSAAYTRNRVRHELLPAMRSYNPQIEQILAHMAANARAEEQHWQAEMARVLPQLLLEGKPVRGGGRRVERRSGQASLALEIVRLRTLDPALQRRVLRAVAERCGATLDFAATERLLTMIAPGGSSGRAAHWHLPGNVRVERSLRELRFERGDRDETNTMPPQGQQQGSMGTSIQSGRFHPSMEYELPVPGRVEALGFQACYRAVLVGEDGVLDTPSGAYVSCPGVPPAQIRAWQPGDRVCLRYSSKPKKVKEVLERMGVRGEEKKNWPVVEWLGNIIWMRGVELAQEKEPGSTGKPPDHLEITEEPLSDFGQLNRQKSPV